MQRGTKQKSIYQHVNDDHFQVKNQGFLLLSFCLYAFLFLQWQNKKEGNGTPLQYSCLENPMDKGAWWAAVHGVTGVAERLGTRVNGRQYLSKWREFCLMTDRLVCLCVRARTRACTLNHVQLFVTPMDCSPPGSFVHGILQARILEWVAISFSKFCLGPKQNE